MRRGSSPRVRGPPVNTVWITVHTGLIPASAGTTRMDWVPKYPSTAHPRECGDHLTIYGQGILEQGSSPRVRGPPEGGLFGGGLVGLIPASAGTTQPLRPRYSSVTAHPRECGDHGRVRFLAWIGWGSSPRVRGPLSGSAICQGRVRLIPASAGTTCKS